MTWEFLEYIAVKNVRPNRFFFCQTYWGNYFFFSAIPILSEWCSWAVSVGEAKETRTQLDEVLRRAGADPFSGKLFWDAKLEFEKAQLESMRYSGVLYIYIKLW